MWSKHRVHLHISRKWLVNTCLYTKLSYIIFTNKWSLHWELGAWLIKFFLKFCKRFVQTCITHIVLFLGLTNTIPVSHYNMIQLENKFAIIDEKRVHNCFPLYYHCDCDCRIVLAMSPKQMILLRKLGRWVLVVVVINAAVVYLRAGIVSYTLI